MQQVTLKRAGQADGEQSSAKPDLSHVGLVVWQSAFVLADWLLRHPPFGQWADVSVLELGCGTGLRCHVLACVSSS